MAMLPAALPRSTKSSQQLLSFSKQNKVSRNSISFRTNYFQCPSNLSSFKPDYFTHEAGSESGLLLSASMKPGFPTMEVTSCLPPSGLTQAQINIKPISSYPVLVVWLLFVASFQILLLGSRIISMIVIYSIIQHRDGYTKQCIIVLSYGEQSNLFNEKWVIYSVGIKSFVSCK